MPVFLTGSGVEQYGPYGNRGVTYYGYPGGAGSVSQLITYPSTGGHVVSFTPHVAHPILDREAVLQASVTPMALEYHPSRVRRGGGGGGGGGGQPQAQSNPPAQKQQQAQSNPPAQHVLLSRLAGMVMKTSRPIKPSRIRWVILFTKTPIRMRAGMAAPRTIGFI